MSEDYINVRYSNKCEHCNTFMRVSSLECPNCGKSIDENCSAEDVNEQSDALVASFGEDDFITCPSCRVVNSIEHENCQTCGFKLTHSFDLEAEH